VTTTARRQLLILLALVLIGGAIVILRSPSSGVGDSGATAPAAGGPQGSRQGNAVGDVRLESLEHRDEEQSTPSRDLFRFESARAASGPAPRPPVNPAPIDPGPPVPTGPPPPPPIPLRYIGYLDQPGEIPRVAVLSDGRGNVFNGKEGDIIEGRYRVLRIGTDSADLIYVDGRGRQTIRLSGQ
jgi:hypothetical protein